MENPNITGPIITIRSPEHSKTTSYPTEYHIPIERVKRAAVAQAKALALLIEIAGLSSDAMQEAVETLVRIQEFHEQRDTDNG